MPPICYHLAVFREAAAAFPADRMGRFLGSSLFGSTLPDCHIISGITRQQTHFVDLSKYPVESGVEGFFKTNPQFREKRNTSPELRALLAGYLSHLITDEIWIEDVYCPCFGRLSPMSDNLMSSVMDRAIQYEMDRRERLNKPLMTEIRGFVEGWSPGNDNIFNFIGLSEIVRWHEFVCQATGRDPSWERFVSYAHHFLVPRNKVDPAQLQAFLDTLPQSVQNTIEYVSTERLREYRHKAVEATKKVIEEYLC